MFEPTLLDYARIVARRYRLVVACLVTTTLTALAVSLLLPRIYRAEATIFVREQPSIVGNVLSQVGLQLPGSSGKSTELVLAMLNSRSLAEAVVNEVNFPHPRKVATAAAPGDPIDDERVGILREMVSTREKRGLVTIGVENADAVLATQIANTYVRLLDKFLQKSTTRRRQFIEGQLSEAQRELMSAEEALRRFQEHNGTIAVDVETEETVKALVALEAEEVKVSAGLAETTSMISETGSLPEIAALETQRAGLLARQAEIQRQLQRAKDRMRSVPTQILEAVRLRRDVELQLKRYALLLEQHQLASIAEQQEEAVFQTIDRAAVPTGPAKPRLMLNLALAVVTGLFVGIASALLLESLGPQAVNKQLPSHA